jgi:hypothetical protein
MCSFSGIEVAFVLNFVHYLWELKTSGKLFFCFSFLKYDPKRPKIVLFNFSLYVTKECYFFLRYQLTFRSSVEALCNYLP